MARKQRWDIGIKDETPYFFTGEFWRRIEPQPFRHFLQATGIRQGIPRKIIKDHLFVEKLVKQFASEARFPVPSTNDIPKINLRNGTLHFTPDGIDLKTFDKQDGLTYRLHYDYDQSASAPLFKQFLNRVLPDVAIQKLIFQYIGYVFLREMRLEKILFFHGNGANGKSVFLNIIRGLIGVEQCCEFSLEGITASESQRAELGHYLLNVSTEISTRLKAEIFKKMASREPLQARRLYKDPFPLRDYATPIFAMNELPKDVEQTEAFYRRFLIVLFNVRIPDSEQDPELANKIISSEMSGVLNWGVRGIQSPISEGQFDIPDIMRGAVEKFRKESDSVLTFLDKDGCSPGMTRWKSLQDMYDAYKKHSRDDGRQQVSKQTFSKRLCSLGYTVEKRGYNKQTVVYLDGLCDTDEPDDIVIPS